MDSSAEKTGKGIKPKIYHTTEHDIDSRLIDPDAAAVTEALKGAGFQAYLVGGSVRDLLRKTKPKDFDISTSATPEQVKHLFRKSCLLIGRRFRLAHIRFGKKIIEVSTFRSGENDSDLITRDNQWGTAEEDVLRRDFTINGLFYDTASHSIIDYVGGWEDIHQKILRTIGDPVVRFRQDPVRMIRLLKFRARFGFDIEAETENALVRCRKEILKSSPARILEEVFRMLESGSSAPFFRLMTERRLLEFLFPCLTHCLESQSGEEVYHYLSIADKMAQNYGSGVLERPVLFSCLLFPILERELEVQYLSQGVVPTIGDIMMLTGSLIQAVITSSFSHFPRRMSSSISFILSTQYRLTPLSGKRLYRPKLLHNKEFALALQLLKIRSLVDEKHLNAYSSWKKIYRQNVHHGDRKPHSHRPPRRFSFRRRRP